MMAAEAFAALVAGLGAVSQARDVLSNALMDKIVSSKDIKATYGALDEAMRYLRAKRDDHEETLQRLRATKRPSKTYSNWIDKVTRIEAEVEEIKTKYERESEQLWFLARSKFGKLMKSKSLEVVKLFVESRQLGDILVEKESERVVKMHAPDISNFSTLQKPLEQILDFLTNKEVKGIRVHGMVGTGKTAIMQNLNNQEKVAEMFERVIWVKVSTEEDNKNLSMEHIQQIIVRRLKLNMEGSYHIDEVAHRIREELRNKKHLLLLDDVKEDLKLDEIGIFLNDDNESKIVLTTRLGHVCHSMVDRVIKVGKLSPKEAWRMFQNVLGHSKFEENPNIERLMHQVVEFCDGLPFAIKMIASAFKMRNTEEECWTDALNNLRKWPDKGDEGMKGMHKLLSFCCDYLEGAQKDCFFYSAIYPEDSDIHTDCLLDCWAAEDLCGTAADDEQVHVDGRLILEYLKTVSLLEEGVCREYVKMHKLIRKAALYNLSADDKYKHLVKTSESLQEPPNMEHWRQKNWISLVHNKLQVLPEHPDCSKLSTLFLQENPSLKKMPDSFFEHMVNLRVLNMCCTGIASLPPSIQMLIRLKVLYLNDCIDLMELPSQIGELEHLEVLDIRGSGVSTLPPNMEKLSCLRRLLASFTNISNRSGTQSLIDNCNVISRISTLEELVIDVKLYKICCNRMLNVVRDKVASLTKLTTLKFCFLDDVEYVIKVLDVTRQISVPEANDLTSFLEKIQDLDSKSFQVFIGCPISSCPQITKFYRYQRYLKCCSGGDSYCSIHQVLALIDAFELVNNSKLVHVSKLGTASMTMVRGCLIESCTKVRTIVDAKFITMGNVMLPNLERLYIKKLPKLESIWKGLVHQGSLSKLRTLKIEECFVIKELIIQSGNRCILPNLRKLILVNMPNLWRICEYESIEWPSLEKLQIYGCPRLIELPFNKYNAMKLRSIEAEQNWWEALHWHDPDLLPQLMQHIVFVNIGNGGN